MKRDAAVPDQDAVGPPIEYSLREIGIRLQLTRQAFSLSQTEFADAAGLTQHAYNQYERGHRRPNIDAAIALCDRYGITLDWIYRGDPSGLPYKLADLIKNLRAHRRG